MTPTQTFQERHFGTTNGWLALAVLLGSFLAISAALLLLSAAPTGDTFTDGYGYVHAETLLSGGATAVIAVLSFGFLGYMAFGLYMNPPLTVSVVSLAGRYKGVDPNEGFRWIWPWYSKQRVSKRLVNTNIQSIRVNDMGGNPIDIGAVVVWRIADAAKSIFHVERYAEFLRNQAEVSLRVLASQAYYDRTEVEDLRDDPKAESPPASAPTLIEDRKEAGEKATRILHELIGDIGVEIESLSITHLAYAPEIASVMLRRQAASAVVAARRKIVEGVAGIVTDAVDKLPGMRSDDDRKGAVAANLLLVLVGEQGVTPVVNVGDIRS